MFIVCPPKQTGSMPVVLGHTTKFSFGDDESELGDYAWYGENANIRTHPVGEKKPNAWGIYDMHGNVWEWCQDWYDDYPSGAVTDPTAPSSGSSRVFRGGGWERFAVFCPLACRIRFNPLVRRDFIVTSPHRIAPS